MPADLPGDEGIAEHARDRQDDQRGKLVAPGELEYVGAEHHGERGQAREHGRHGQRPVAVGCRADLRAPGPAPGEDEQGADRAGRRQAGEQRAGRVPAVQLIGPQERGQRLHSHRGAPTVLLGLAGDERQGDAGRVGGIARLELPA
ncbi:MAG: hypothetical protein ACLPKE_19130 [Streptosporangiaceae bacterium]